MLTLYRNAKWYAARASVVSYRSAMCACVALGLAANLLARVSFAPALSWSSQRELQFGILMAAVVGGSGMFWSRIHVGQQQASLQLVVENRNALSVHWTPLPEWITWLQIRAAALFGKPHVRVVPRKVAIEQLRQWVVLAHEYGFREIRLDSPLFIERSEDGAVAQRRRLAQFLQPIEEMGEVNEVVIEAPRRLSLAREISYRLFWRNAAKRVCQEEEGRMLSGGVVIHLA
jgi:hypothetical protein